MKIRVESSHKAIGSLADHAAGGSADGFLAKLAEAEGWRWSDSVDLGDDMQRHAGACPARFTFPDTEVIALSY
jgi:hypothetical protein